MIYYRETHVRERHTSVIKNLRETKDVRDTRENDERKIGDRQRER